MKTKALLSHRQEPSAVMTSGNTQLSWGPSPESSPPPAEPLSTHRNEVLEGLEARPDPVALGLCCCGTPVLSSAEGTIGGT